MQKQKKSFIQNTNTHLLVSKATNRIHFMLIEKQPKKKDVIYGNVMVLC